MNISPGFTMCPHKPVFVPHTPQEGKFLVHFGLCKGLESSHNREGGAALARLHGVSVTCSRAHRKQR